jgi:hypothetical protein
MYVVIDVETENTDTDIMKDNKRIISVQIGDATQQELYYDDSKDPQWTLKKAKMKIMSLLSQGYVFTGYNIKNFDFPILNQFLKVEIPDSNIFDLSQMPRVIELKKNKIFRLEDICEKCGIEVNHKRKMNEKAQKYKERHDIVELAYSKAEDLVKNKGWNFDFSYKYALDKIAGGNAIFDSYQEFVNCGGKKDTLFYEYAIGDVICEYRLLKALR